jgi:hypothetical protein
MSKQGRVTIIVDPPTNPRSLIIDDSINSEDCVEINQNINELNQAVTLKKNNITEEQILHEQDQVLEDMSKSLERIHGIGTDIKTEIKIQNSLLEQTDEEIENAKSGLNRAMKLMQRIEKSVGRSKLCMCMVVLIILCIVFLLVIIYG